MSDIYQYIKVEGQSARSVALKHGMPQGTALATRESLSHTVQP